MIIIAAEEVAKAIRKRRIVRDTLRWYPALQQVKEFEKEK
jgi:hypothetical protein